MILYLRTLGMIRTSRSWRRHFFVGRGGSMIITPKMRAE